MKNIVIVGGGISGLTCARELSKHAKHLNITVLEASHRIGGRIFTALASDGIKLELGAHYIHGTKNNPIYDFAMKKGLLEEDKEKVLKHIHCFHKEVQDGYSDQMKRKAIEEGIDYVFTVLEEFYEQPIESLFQKYSSVGDYVRQQLQAKLEEHRADSQYQKLLKSVFVFMMNAENNRSGCTSLNDLDVRGHYEYVDLDGDRNYKLHKNGYSRIVDEIHREILVDCINLDHEVIKIEETGEQSDDVTKESNQSNIKITCSNGNIFYADIVVLTVSIEVLKELLLQDKLQISHAQDKLPSMNGLCLGRVVKLYFKFTEPISSEYNFISLYPSADNFDHANCDKYSRVHILHRVQDTQWWSLWLNGGLSEEFQSADYISFLKELLENFKSMYPEFPKSTIDEESITFYDWIKDPFYRGSYSYLKVGSTSADILKLQEPLPCGNGFVLFAGEMTDPAFYSTTHGAYNSGIREANRALNICNVR